MKSFVLVFMNLLNNYTAGYDLYVTNNNLYALLDPYIEKSKIKKIFFIGNLIKEIPYEIREYENVEKIFTSCTNLARISEEVGKLSSLKELTIANFTINNIDKSIKNLKNLKDLIIATDKSVRNIGIDENIDWYKSPQDKIQVLEFKEEEFQSLEKLEITLRYQTLDLTSSKNEEFTKLYHYIDYLPDEICLLKNLKTLSICSQNLKTLPDAFGDLQNLENLTLCNNPIKNLPVSFAKLKNLKELSFVNHKLNKIPECISYLSNLKKLIFKRERSGHDLQCSDGNLYFDFSHLKNLRYLDFRNMNNFRFHKSILKLKENKLELVLETEKLLKDDEGDFIGLYTLYKNFINI